MRPRTLGKIVIVVLMVICMMVAVIYALESPEDTAKLYKCLRGVTFSVLALAFATLYRYFED